MNSIPIVPTYLIVMLRNDSLFFYHENDIVKPSQFIPSYHILDCYHPYFICDGLAPCELVCEVKKYSKILFHKIVSLFLLPTYCPCPSKHMLIKLNIFRVVIPFTMSKQVIFFQLLSVSRKVFISLC